MNRALYSPIGGSVSYVCLDVLSLLVCDYYIVSTLHQDLQNYPDYKLILILIF